MERCTRGLIVDRMGRVEYRLDRKGHGTDERLLVRGYSTALKKRPRPPSLGGSLLILSNSTKRQQRDKLLLRAYWILRNSVRHPIYLVLLGC